MKKVTVDNLVLSDMNIESNEPMITPHELKMMFNVTAAPISLMVK